MKKKCRLMIEGIPSSPRPWFSVQFLWMCVCSNFSCLSAIAAFYLRNGEWVKKEKLYTVEKSGVPFAHSGTPRKKERWNDDNKNLLYRFFFWVLRGCVVSSLSESNRKAWVGGGGRSRVCETNRGWVCVKKRACRLYPAGWSASLFHSPQSSLPALFHLS